MNTPCPCCQQSIGSPACICKPDLCRTCQHCEAHCTCIQIEGLAKHAPIITNTRGGSQSDTPYSFVQSFPHKGLFAVAKVVKTGLTRYEPDNWRKIPRTDHINHAMAHICAWGAGDHQDDHLEHAACRLLFALECE